MMFLFGLISVNEKEIFLSHSVMVNRSSFVIDVRSNPSLTEIFVGLGSERLFS